MRSKDVNKNKIGTKVVRYLTKKIQSSLAKDIFWTLIGQITVLLVLLVVNKLLSNILSVEDFGKYNIIKRSTSVLSFVLLGGMGIAIPRYLSISILHRYNIRKTQILLRAAWIYLILVNVITSVIYLLLFTSISNIVIASNDFTLYVLCLIYSITIALGAYVYAYYRGIGDFKLFNISQIFFQLLTIVPFAFDVRSLTSIIGAWTLLNLGFVIFFSIKEIHKYSNIINRFNFKINEIRNSFVELSRFSFPRLIGDFFLFAYSAFPVIYVGSHLGYEETSYYSIGVSLVTMITPVFSFLGVILLPLVAKDIANNQAEKANRLVKKLSVLYIVVALLLTLVVYFGMEYMISFFFAEKYLQALPFAKVISLSLLPQAMYLLYRNPNDAASVFPYNTIIIMFSLTVMVLGFCLSRTLLQFAYIYLVTSIIQGVFSFGTWQLILLNKKNDK